MNKLKRPSETILYNWLLLYIIVDCYYCASRCSGSSPPLAATIMAQVYELHHLVFCRQHHCYKLGRPTMWIFCTTSCTWVYCLKGARNQEDGRYHPLVLLLVLTTFLASRLRYSLDIQVDHYSNDVRTYDSIHLKTIVAALKCFFCQHNIHCKYLGVFIVIWKELKSHASNVKRRNWFITNPVEAVTYAWNLPNTLRV